MSAAFHFLRPEWLFALPFIALLLVLLVKRTKKNSGWESVCDAELLRFQLAQQSGQNSKSSEKSFHLLHWTVPLLFFVTIIALAGPSWEKKEQPVFQQGNALVIVLDLSLSMNAKDIKPSRLERAKLKLIDILKQKKEGQTALIAFAGDAHTVSPLTIDNKTIMSLLPALDSSIMPLSGSHLIDALNTAKQLFKNAGFAQGDILLITDGIDPSQQSKLKQSIKKLRKQGYHFSIIGVGTQAGSPIPLPGEAGFVKDQSGQVVLSKLSAEPLNQLAQLGNGYYHKLTLDDSDFKDLIEQNWNTNKSAVEQDDHLDQWVDAGAYLTLLLIPFALFTFRKGLLTILLIVLFTPDLVIKEAYASDASNKQSIVQFNPKWENKWDKLWSTPNQQGQKAFNTQDYQKAADSFSNKNWKAGAQYRAGNFAQALEQYSQSDDAVSLYNKGNTLANMQKFQEAAEAYEQAIEKQPQFKNASKNLDYMKELIAQQKKQQQDQKNSDKNQEKSDQQSENQQQDQKNSTDDDASEGNDSDSKDSEKNSSDESDSEGSESDKKNEENSAEKSQEQDDQKKENESDEAQNDEPQSSEAKSPEEYQQQNAKEKESDKDAEQQAKPIEEDKAEDKNEDEQPGVNDTQSDVLSQLNQEEQQSLKQWLQRIPDNPGKLLKVKFRNNTLLKQREQIDTDEKYKGNPW